MFLKNGCDLMLSVPLYPILFSGYTTSKPYNKSMASFDK